MLDRKVTEGEKQGIGLGGKRSISAESMGESRSGWVVRCEMCGEMASGRVESELSGQGALLCKLLLGTQPQSSCFTGS